MIKCLPFAKVIYTHEAVYKKKKKKMQTKCFGVVSDIS